MFTEWFILATCILSILISISFILFVIFATSIHSISIALTCHSSIVTIMTNIVLLETAVCMQIFNKENTLWCQVNAYCLQVSLILVYHSYYLQAFHRFTSVVYHNNVALRTYHIFVIILILQWLFAWFYPFRLFKLGLFTYNSAINICHLDWNVTHELFLLLSVEYLIPLIIDAYFYISVIKHAHLHIAHMIHPSISHHRHEIIISQEQRRIKREFKMLKRIILVYLALVTMNSPSLIQTIMAAIDSQDNLTLEYSYRITLVFLSCMLLLISIFQFALTSSVKTLIQESLRRRTNQVYA